MGCEEKLLSLSRRPLSQLRGLSRSFPDELVEERTEAMRAAVKPFTQVFVPIFASGHWTLLVSQP